LVGLHYAGPNATSTFLTDYMLAPIWQGTQSTQDGVKQEYAGVVRTTTSAAVTILTIPVPTGAAVAIEVFCAGRDQASGTVGNGFASWSIFLFKNIAGTVSQGATVATPVVASDTTL